MHEHPGWSGGVASSNDLREASVVWGSSLGCLTATCRPGHGEVVLKFVELRWRPDVIMRR